MQRLVALGAACTLAGLVGYAVGIEVAYPGRAFSVTAMMAGIGLLVLGRAAPEVTP